MSCDARNITDGERSPQLPPASFSRARLARPIAAPFSDDTTFRGAQLTHITGVNDSDVSKLIADSPCKSCGLDPLSIWLLKLCSSEFVAMITAIINSSLESSTVHDAFKQAVVRPVLKKGYAS